MSALPRRLSVATAIASVLLCVPLTPAGAQRPDPSQRLHDAKATAAADKERLAQAQQHVASAQTRLTALAETAQRATDRYTAALARLRDARDAVAAAKAALAAAAADAESQQKQVDRFVRAAYMSGGPFTTFATVLSANGPRAIMNRAALLNVVSESQATMVRHLQRARERENAAADVAAAATAEVEGVVAHADAARRTALMAMTNQHTLVAKLKTEQSSIAQTLAAHESDVAGLAHQQAAERVRAKLAAQRAVLAASWDELQAAGEAMPMATAKQGRRVAKWAKRQLGVPYSWGGGDERGPTLGMVNKQGNPAGLHTVGYDCSGLTLFAWGHVGFRLDHYTGYQWVEGHHIPLEEMRPGDLVFFARNTANPMTIHHVGIYVGEGKMIDAPHTGADVRYDDVFVPGLIGAVRP